MSERKLVPNPPVSPEARKRIEKFAGKPKSGPPVCPECGTPMPGMRNVCTECGYTTRWFKVRFWVGSISVLFAVLGLSAMIWLAMNTPEPTPADDEPIAVEGELSSEANGTGE